MQFSLERFLHLFDCTILYWKQVSVINSKKYTVSCNLNEFLFQNRNVELQKTFMPASLAQVKDYDITCMTQFNLRKIPPPQEPRSRADILEYISKDIIHVSCSLEHIPFNILIGGRFTFWERLLQCEMESWIFNLCITPNLSTSKLHIRSGTDVHVSNKY